MSIIIIIAIAVLGISLYDYFDSKDWQQITCVDRINVVFEDRNKKYGAYSIRRDYNDLLLFIMIGVFVLFGAFQILTAGLSPTMEELQVPVVEMDTTLLTLQEPPEDKIETIESPYKIVGGGGGEGSPDNSKYDPTPDPMVKEQNTIDKSDEKIFSGKGNKTTGKDTKEEASTSVKSPFSGSGGKGNSDKGGLWGKDNGPGGGPGNGPGSNGGTGGNVSRRLISTLPTSQIQSDEDCKVKVKVRINADGDVTATPIFVRDGSTTDNTTIINEVLRLVKAHAKFSKAAGAADQMVFLTVNVSAR
jgi:hypothetical protein